jgi:flagellar hook-associated protein 2
MAISIAGVGSGLDINSIVSALVGAESAPTESRIKSSLARQTVQISAMGAVKSALSDFQETLKEISESVELVGQKMNMPETEGITLTQTDRSAPGNYSLEVIGVADRQKNISISGLSPGTNLGTGTIRVTSSGGDEVDISIGAGSGSMAGVAKMINDNSDDTGVNARVMVVKDINGDDVEKLVFESVDTGADQGFSVSVVSQDTGSGLSAVETTGMNTISSAADAEIKVDGERFTESTNTFSTAITGVDIQVDVTSVGAIIAMQIEASTPPIKDKLTAFVDAYNQMLGAIDKHSAVGSDGKRNTLENNSMVRQIKNEIRLAVSKSTEVDGTSVTLSQMGIMTNASSGLLELNEPQMNRFMEDNSDLVQGFFQQADTGILDRMTTGFEPFTQSGGIIDTSNNTAQARISRLNIDLIDHEAKMGRFESAMLDKYTKMDIIMAKLSSQNTAISAMLNSGGSYRF